MKDLYNIALRTIMPIKLKKNGEAGHVACALETASGTVFTGICIDVPEESVLFLGDSTSEDFFNDE